MADGARRAEIKRAEGIKQAKILEAEGEAQAIQLVNEAADRYFVGNAQLLRRLMTVEKSLAANTKIVIPANTELVNIIGDMAGLLPIGRGAPSAASQALHSGGNNPLSALAETTRHLPHA
jgi:regulator of protease activity HflC (stomatin/prohibitin superfamily)